MMPYAQVPQYARDILEPLVGSDLPWGSVDVQVKRLGPAAVAAMAAGVMLSRGPVCWRSPCSCRPSVGSVLAHVHAGAGLNVAGLSEDGKIYLDPHFAENLDTASGLALLAHEMVHQGQFVDIPDFEHVYEHAQAGVPKDRPWKNRFEYPAYRTERAVYCYLRKNRPDIAPGSWVPLGVQQWGC